MIKIWGRGLLDILNVKVEVHGDESPLNGALVVSNHLGVLDILVHSSLFGFRFAPKSDIRSWPFLGAYVGLTYPIWVDRGSKARSQELLAEFHDTLTNGVSLIVYPEGTSSDGKHGVLPFKSTPFEAVVKGRLPVRPVLTLYRVPATSNVEPCWYGDMTLPPHIWDLLSAPGIVAEIHVLPEFKAPADMDRKALAEHVHALLQAEYERVMAEREKTAPSAKTPSAC
jgi:1-acyl-sn-glycerol-3-phosphate acyltransferase